MLPSRNLICAGFCLAFIACSDGPRPGDLGLTNAIPPASVLRLPRAGGPPTVYRLPQLTDAEWIKTGAFPPLRQVIGADLDQRLVFAAGAENQIVALDLENGKVRSYLTGARNTIIGPDGVLFTIDDSNHVTQIARRTPARFSGRLPGKPAAMFGTLGDELLAVVPVSGNQLITLSHDEPIRRVDLPAGDAAATMWGDLVAIAADTAVVLYDPAGQPPVRSISVDGHARQVAFSASGHRIYVAQQSGQLLEIDRFTDRILRKIELPGPVADLRRDTYGRYLMVRPADADSLWIVDLSTGRYLADWSTTWTSELPAVAGTSVLLLRQGADLVAYDLDAEDWPERGRVKGGGDDLWLPIAWTPEGGTRVSQPDSTAKATPDSTPSSQVFLQVSSSQNPDWAEDLANKLREVGLKASVLRPKRETDAYRVVLGPYDSRETAEEEGRKLGRPFFIYQPEPQ
ncbi:MAG: SPOR domain-containing protein [Gemmatimonadota bacterium]